MNVAIAGYGVEGRASYRYWRNKGDDVTILDEGDLSAYDIPYGAKARLGKGAFDHLRDFDVVVRSPSISPDRLKKARRVTSASQEFFEHCPAPIIGVTGTKGKGTTASLIHSILTSDGIRSWLVGNIGTPSLEVLPELSSDDVVVYELSSFQLWDMTRSPHIAVVLGIEPEHLNVHKNFAEYVNAKATITRYQTSHDSLIYNTLNDTATHIAIQSNAQHIPYPDERFAHESSGNFYYNEQLLCSVSSLKLPGKHNIENAIAAIAAAWEYVQQPEAIAAGLAAFEGLPHRLKFVAEKRGVQYYDDSIATTPGSAIAALRAFAAPKVLIVGGSDKGADFDELFREIAAQQSSVRAIIAIGERGSFLARGIRAHGFSAVETLPATAPMSDIVTCAARHAASGDYVILSPACASFDQYLSYADRGQQFVTAVEAL